MCCLRFQAGTRLALVLVFACAIRRLDASRANKERTKSGRCAMPAGRSVHNAWMVDGLWNVNVGQFDEDDFGCGSDGLDRNG